MNATKLMPQPLTRREFADTERAMREAIAPIVREMVRVHCYATPTYRRYADGRFEMSDDGLTEPMRNAIKSLEAMREHVAAPYLEKMRHGYRGD